MLSLQKHSKIVNPIGMVPSSHTKLLLICGIKIRDQSLFTLLSSFVKSGATSVKKKNKKTKQPEVLKSQHSSPD